MVEPLVAQLLLDALDNIGVEPADKTEWREADQIMTELRWLARCLLDGRVRLQVVKSSEDGQWNNLVTFLAERQHRAYRDGSG